MNYLNIYNRLMHKRHVIEPLTKNKQSPGKFELHHIVPRSCNGSDIDSNKILLTAREHVLAHHLLAKIYCNTKYAFNMLHTYYSMVGKKYQNSKLFQTIREQTAKTAIKKYGHKFRLNLGKVFVNNGIEQLMCFEDQIPAGYSRGMLFKEKIRYVHDPIACKSKRIPVSAPLPPGYVEGIYFSPAARKCMSNGGKKNKKK